MPRLFIALDIPDETKEKLADLGRDLPGAAWVSPNQMHLTLRFLGETTREDFRMIAEALEGIRCPAFLLSLQGIGHFPKRGEPETLWIGTPLNQRLITLRNRI